MQSWWNSSASCRLGGNGGTLEGFIDCSNTHLREKRGQNDDKSATACLPGSLPYSNPNSHPSSTQRPLVSSCPHSTPDLKCKKTVTRKAFLEPPKWIIIGCKNFLKENLTWNKYIFKNMTVYSSMNSSIHSLIHPSTDLSFIHPLIHL